MSEEDSDDVDRLAQSIADGASINWDEIDKLPADARLKRLFSILQMIDGVAEVHRSLGDPSHATGPDPDGHTTPAPLDAQEDGDGLGRWGHLVLRRKIGEGGYGEVYHAHDTWLDHPVALKLFKPRATGRNTTDRILHEARKLARIRHPNVVTVHGADSHDGRVGFWMDLIEGISLERIVQTRRLSAGEATHIGQEVCRALAAVHRAGIIHRDIKAQNVMRASEDGRLIVMDFGAGEFMAEAPDDSPRQGTPVYLAPEIFNGRPASVRSDIYAVGVLLYFLVTGTFPIRGTSVAALIDAHRNGQRTRLRDARPDLPPAFVSIVERALDPDPARRFSSAGEMEASLTGGSIPNVVPIDMSRFTPGNELRTVAQKAASVAAIGIGAIAAAAALGWIASRVFEVAIGVEPDFAAGPFDYLSVGAQCLVPFVILWAAGGAVLAALAGMRIVRRPLGALRRRAAKGIPAMDAESLATLVFLAGVAGLVLINWVCWDIFYALEALRTGAPVKTVDLSILASADPYPLYRKHADLSVFLSFLLVLAVLWLFPRFEKDAVDPARVRALKWSTVVVAFLTVAMAITPRRFIWENFEVVTFENQTAFVIGNNREELLLYYPYNDTPKHRRVRADAPALQRTGTRARIFEPR